MQIPDKELGLVAAVLSDFLDNSKNSGASFVFDSITELIRVERWEPVYSGIKQLIDLLTVPNATALFLANINTMEPRFLGALHGAFALQLRLFFFQAEDGIRDPLVTGVQTCALPICSATVSITAQTPASATGSFEPTPNSRLDVSRVRTSAETSPMPTPLATTVIPCTTISRSTRTRLPPSARRMPISFVCCCT